MWLSFLGAKIIGHGNEVVTIGALDWTSNSSFWWFWGVICGRFGCKYIRCSGGGFWLRIYGRFCRGLVGKVDGFLDIWIFVGGLYGGDLGRNMLLLFGYDDDNVGRIWLECEIRMYGIWG